MKKRGKNLKTIPAASASNQQCQQHQIGYPSSPCLDLCLDLWLFGWQVLWLFLSLAESKQRQHHGDEQSKTRQKSWLGLEKPVQSSGASCAWCFRGHSRTGVGWGCAGRILILGGSQHSSQYSSQSSCHVRHVLLFKKHISFIFFSYLFNLFNLFRPERRAK